MGAFGLNDCYVQLNFKSHNVLLQSLVRLKEPDVLLRCRKEDVHLVESVLDSAKEEYASKVNVHPPEIIIDGVHLPPAPSHHNNAHGPFWYISLLLNYAMLWQELLILGPTFFLIVYGGEEWSLPLWCYEMAGLSL